ncbi:uncharacterized protein LOC135331250 [Halichondria panicea]|uniref:uncharacterized protein LOC135331250 n=1 Tax=Halichondria panicea TaxID=6063 RepID=UPI00312B5EA8
MDYEFLRNGLDDHMEFQKHCTLFLERMRHSSSFELVQRVKTFVNQFYGTQGSAEEYSHVIRDFVEETSLSLRDHPLWRDEGEEEIKWAVEGVEKFLMTKLYKVTFFLPSSTDEEDDEKFFTRVRTLQFIQPKHLDIPDRPLNKIALEMATEELAYADSDKMNSPREKLTCILNCITVITNLLKHYSQEKGTGADDLLPYIIYTLLLLSPKHMYSNLRFINRFRRESEMKSEAGYYFTQMESAVMFIMEVQHRNLSLSQEEFDRGMRSSEELIQSGLDLPTFVTSSARPKRPHSSSISAPDTTSPMVARRANVIQEWNKLQRTHSKSGKEKGEPAKQWNGPKLSDHSLERPRMSTGRGETTDPATLKHLDKKVLSSRFEDMTVADLRQMFTNYQILVKKPGQHELTEPIS